MKRWLPFVVALWLTLAWTVTTNAIPAFSATTPDQVLATLQEGNARFVTGVPRHPHQDQARRTETISAQTPFAILLSCSDSRVPVETLFDQGLGDIFTVRVAGNVALASELGSIEYGAEHLGVPLLMVLGHTKCGAVTAVVKGDEVGGNIKALVEPIKPAFRTVIKRFPDLNRAELVPKAIEQNIWQAIEDIFAKSPVVAHLVRDGKLKVVGALYDIETGKVDIFGEHPGQETLLPQ